MKSLTSFTSAVSGKSDQSALSRCSRHLLSVNLIHLLAFSGLAFTAPGALGLTFMTPDTLGPTFHDFDRVSRSPSSACTASPPAAASFRSLCTFRACRSVKSAPSELTRLLPFDVKASHSARGFDIRMQSRQESAPRPFSFLLVRCHIPHRHPRFGFGERG